MEHPPGSREHPDRALARLAELYGVQTSYVDAFGHHARAKPEALVAVLRCLGAPLDSAAGAAEAHRARRLEIEGALSEPIVVAWEGHPLRIPLADTGDGSYRATLVHENGDRLGVQEGRLASLSRRAAEDRADGARREVVFRDELPFGIHSLRLEVGSRAAEVSVFRAPARAWQAESRGHWGLFAPTYALHSRRTPWGGDLTDLETLLEWTESLGGSCVATLPLLAAFLDEPFEPSPYAPASRLFWNELYLDPERLPELERCPAARARLASAEYRESPRALPPREVDHRWRMRQKRALLQDLARTFFAGSQERDAFEAYLRTHPRAEDYARFRATLERERKPWLDWPARQRSGELREGDYSEEDRDVHLYAQWRTHEQVARLGPRDRPGGLGLYLDLPLGVHPAAYETWRLPADFLTGCSAGAPPDSVFTGGQSWGLAPLHPEAARRSAYGALAEALRHHLASAGALRIDHVMGLQRIYCVPHGMDRRDGVYVGYRSEELYALLTLESWRHRCLLIGEDLGTVPPETRRDMEAHGIHRMHVMQYECGGERPFARPAHGVLASLNTHDMPPFAGWCEGGDIADRLDLGLASQAEADQERATRAETLRALRAQLLSREGPLPDSERLELLRALLEECATSDATLLIVSLEDLWLETAPQNVPGTCEERVNWRRLLAHDLEAIRSMDSVREILAAVSRARAVAPD